MMEKLERLGRPLRPHPEEGGEQPKPAKGLRWYHRAFAVPALALTLFAAGLVAPSEAEAHSGQWFQQYGFGQGWCLYDHWESTDTYYNSVSGVVNEPRGCASLQRYDYNHGNQYMYIPTRDPYNFTRFNSNSYWYVIWDDGSWAGPYSIMDHFCWNYDC